MVVVALPLALPTVLVAGALEVPVREGGLEVTLLEVVAEDLAGADFLVVVVVVGADIFWRLAGGAVGAFCVCKRR